MADTAWMKMKKGDLIRPNKKLGNNVLECFGIHINPSLKLLSIVSNWSENAGLFSREKLDGIVRENITLEPLKDKLVYVSLSALALRIKKFGTRKFVIKSEYTYLDTKSGDSREKNIKKVLASAQLEESFFSDYESGQGSRA